MVPRVAHLPSILFAALVLAIAPLGSFASAKPPSVTRFTLKNGLRVVVLHVPEAKDFGAFTVLPLALAFDGREKTQWSHLIEHLTIRTTGPVADYRRRNGETFHDAMHLDALGPQVEWQAALDLQFKWLSGMRFSIASFEEEVPNALSEIDATLKNQFTHKWATAAWNQVVRHGAPHVAVRGALESAALQEVENYRNRHFLDFRRTVLCVIGSVPPEIARRTITKRFSGLTSNAEGPPRATRDLGTTRGIAATWDLPARHYIETYPAPADDHPDYPALYVASFLLRARLYSDPALKKHAVHTLCDLDLRTPERTYFQVSASLKSGGSAELAKKRIGEILAAGIPAAANERIPPIAAQLAHKLRQPADVGKALQAKPPNLTDAMFHANIAVQWAILEFRYGDLRAQIADAVEAVTADDLRRAIRNHLAPAKRVSLTFRPQAPSTEETPGGPRTQ